MTEQTRCPACGAPLTAAGDQDVISCDFCNTQIRVLHEEEGDRYEVLGQPVTRQEELSQPVDEEVEEVLLSALAPEEEPLAATTETPAPFGLPLTEERETAYSSSGPGDTFFAPPPPVASPAPSPAGGAQVFGAPSVTTTGASASRAGGLPRWALITIIVVVVLCLACACVAGGLSLLPALLGGTI